MEGTQFTKKSFVILGAGGLARELVSWVLQTPQIFNNYELKGFLSDPFPGYDNAKSSLSIVGAVEDKSIKSAGNILIGVAKPEFKRRIFPRLKAPGVSLLSLTHPSAVIGNDNVIGEAFVICPNASITCNVTIGEGVFVNLGSQIGHDVKIGNYTSIMANVDLGGGAEIGSGVFIGSNAVILPGVKILDNTTIGAGSVVIRSIKEPGSYFGNPAKRIF